MIIWCFFHLAYFLRFILVIAYISTFISSYWQWIFPLCIYQVLCILLSIHRHLSCFYSLALRTEYLYTSICVDLCFISLGYITRSRNGGKSGNYVSPFEKPPGCFPKWLYQFYISTSSMKALVSLYLHQYLLLLYSSHSSG